MSGASCAWPAILILLPSAAIAVQSPPPTPPPTWGGTVREIIEANCVQCHHVGGEAPFSLTRYEDVAPRALFIAEVTSKGRMPPWIPGEKGLPLHGHRGLSAGHIAALAAWAEAGHPVGANERSAEFDTPPKQSPDVTVSMPSPWTIPAEGGSNWGRRDRDKRTFVLPIGNTTPLQVQAITHQSAAPKAIHAVSYLVDTTGAAAWNDRRDEELGTYMSGDVLDQPSGACGVTGVGARTCRLPDGFHWDVPAQSDLVMEVHFRPSGRAQPLQESLGLTLSTSEPSRPVRTLLSMVRRLDVPIGAAVEVADEYVLPEDVEVVGLTPRAMGVCTAIQMTADVPGEGEVMLMDLPNFDPHWRLAYMLKEPLYLPAGTVIRSHWEIENTETNPRNPFVPLERLSMARRTGAVAALLHVAAEDEAADQRLVAWQRASMRSRTH